MLKVTRCFVKLDCMALYFAVSPAESWLPCPVLRFVSVKQRVIGKNTNPLVLSEVVVVHVLFGRAR